MIWSNSKRYHLLYSNLRDFWLKFIVPGVALGAKEGSRLLKVDVNGKTKFKQEFDGKETGKN